MKSDNFSYEVIKEGEEFTLRIDAEKYHLTPSIEDDPVTMAVTFDYLAEAGNVTKIVFSQKRDYEYDFDQTKMLAEIANLYNKIQRQRLLSYYAIKDTSKFNDIQRIIFQLLKSDPLGAYVELKRILRRENIIAQKTLNRTTIEASKKYIGIVKYLINLLDKTEFIRRASPYLPGHKVGDRDVYRKILNPTIKPDFMFTKLMASYPSEGEELDSYEIEGNEITIFSLPDTVQILYHIMPPEFKLSEDRYELVDLSRKIMAEHKPTRQEFVDPQRMRQVFSNVGRDLIEELAGYRGIRLREKELNQITKILVRYTVGFGLIEVLLQDEKVQDITINSPMGQVPIFLVHQNHGECYTNIIPTTGEAESWASKMRMISGRPLDEANPILDTELSLPGASARVAIVAPPLNPSGLAYSFRRHRDNPWTLPLFIKHKMINSLAAGLISFLVDGSRTLLIAGTRSAGKTSLLGAVLTEIMRKYRMITIEDTLELPTAALRKLGYNIQSLKVAAAMTKGTSEVSAAEGIRTTLRMGDSGLIIGEVRSTEAKALYEAMRIGALANVVAGTIHGDSPYGVFDRVVNDLGVPKTSFKATDIIIVANPIRSSDGLHRWRRVTQITEVRKHWVEDPLLEQGFSDLMKYDSKTDQLVPSDDLINGESDILKAIASNVKEWAGNWDAIWDNITLRAKIKQTIVDFASKQNMDSILEADFVIRANDEFHKISDRIKDEVGSLDPKRIFFEWNEWLLRSLKKVRIE